MRVDFHCWVFVLFLHFSLNKVTPSSSSIRIVGFLNLTIGIRAGANRLIRFDPKKSTIWGLISGISMRCSYLSNLNLCLWFFWVYGSEKMQQKSCAMVVRRMHTECSTKCLRETIIHRGSTHLVYQNLCWVCLLSFTCRHRGRLLWLGSQNLCRAHQRFCRVQSCSESRCPIEDYRHRNVSTEACIHKGMSPQSLVRRGHHHVFYAEFAVACASVIDDAEGCCHRTSVAFIRSSAEIHRASALQRGSTQRLHLVWWFFFTELLSRHEDIWECTWSVIHSSS